MFEASLYQKRRTQLKSRIKNGLVLILGNNEVAYNYPNNTYKFRQDSNFLYFFGLNLPEFAGLLDVDSGEEILFGNDVDIDDIIWMGAQPSVKELGEKVGIHSTRPFKELAEYVKKAIIAGRKIHFLPPYRYRNMQFLEDVLGLHHSMLKDYASLELVHAVISLRSIKDSYEIEEIRRACNIGYEMHIAAMRNCHAGRKEQEIAGILEGISASYGSMVSFPVILSQNGQTLHNHDHSQTLQKGRMMLTDAGAENDMNYCSDFTRTTPVDGVFDQRQKDIYNIVLACNEKAREISKPGVTYLSIHLNVCKILTEGLKALGLMKGNTDDAVAAGAHALFMPHGLGHMMGLDVHDMEDLDQIYVGYDEKTRPATQFGTASLRMGRELQEGFVVTDEPGCYFIPELIDRWKQQGLHKDFLNYDVIETYKNFGGIRIEDDLLITSDGCRLLGDKRLPVTPEEIEIAVNG
ncbi:MAG: aminopeptidase P family protein [Culturomica sp.]|jgi:Xaa-Pro aminopeptidase|nr:aminopeptidase P family protein [Culturomica sp.]